MTKLPFPMSLSTSLTPLDLIHSDVWGPSPIISSNGNRYYVSFIDNFNKFTWLFPIAYKFDVPSIIKKIVPFIENQISQKMKKFRSDKVVNFATPPYNSVLIPKVFLTKNHVLILLNKMVLLNVTIVTLLKL